LAFWAAISEVAKPGPAEPGERIGLGPFHVIDIDVQGAFRAGGRRRGHECQRRLLERERLQRLRTIAAAEDLLARFAVRGLDDVSVDG
jgi:hypothetical protein